MSVTELQSSLRAIAERARAINTRDFEGRSRRDLERELLPVLATVLSDASDSLGSVLHYYEEVNERRAKELTPVETREFYRTIDGLMTEESGTQRIIDLAFMAQWELKRKAQQVQAPGNEEDDVWDLIARCGSARRRILKSAVAVETAICEHEAIASTLEHSYVTELKRSLETRRAYVVFRRELKAPHGNDVATIRRSLRTAGIGIARLIGRDIYEDLRVTDRTQIRELQARLLAWLRGDDDFDSDSGLKTWQDLSAFADLLLQVNHRAELVEHDRALLAEAHETLISSQSTPETLLASLRQQLESLIGRDGALDELIENSESPIEEWRLTVRRLFQVPDDGFVDPDSTALKSEGNERRPVNV